MGKKAEKVTEEVRYKDIATFMRKVKHPVFYGEGAEDVSQMEDTCDDPSVFSTFEQSVGELVDAARAASAEHDPPISEESQALCLFSQHVSQ